MNDDWHPCSFIQYDIDDDDSPLRFGLLFEEFGDTQDFLEAQGFMGGGYTWHGIVESMIRQQAPALNEELNYDPESSMFCVRSTNVEALRVVLDCIRSALADQKVLQAAIDAADPSIIE